MRTTLDRYPGYTFIDGKVISPKGRELKAGERGYILVNNKGTKTSVSIKSLVRQLKPPLLMEEGSKGIPGEDGYFISPKGTVYSFNPIKNPNGTTLTHGVNSSGYLQVRIRGYTRDVHMLMAITFLDPNYRAKGLVCMHLDNNKGNPRLTNLRLGTHSENTQAAHDDGLYLNKRV